MKLVFLTDITGHLNMLTLQLQGVDQTVLALFDAWKAGLAKEKVFSCDIPTGAFCHFRHQKETISPKPVNPKDFRVNIL